MSKRKREPATLEVHEHSWVSGPDANRSAGRLEHAHEGGDVPHRHPDTGPAYYGRRTALKVKPTGPQLPYIERPPAESTFRVVVEEAYTDAHLSAGISREEHEAGISALRAAAAGQEVETAGALGRMVGTFRLTPMYEFHGPGEEGAA